MIKKAIYWQVVELEAPISWCPKALYHILQTPNPAFDIISGVSVGSINAAILAEHADSIPSIWNRFHMRGKLSACSASIAALCCQR